MKKKLFSLALALALCMGLTVSVSAVEPVVTSRPDTDTESKWPKSGLPETGLSLYTEIKTVMSTNGPWVPGIPTTQERPVGFICYGLKDSSGNIVLPANYTRLIYLGPDRLYVGAFNAAENGFAVIDLHGNIVIPYGKYDINSIEIARANAWVLMVNTGRWTDQDSSNSYIGLYDWDGNAIFNYGDYNSIFHNGEGYFVVGVKDGREGIYEYGVGMTFPLQNQYRSIADFQKSDLFRVQNQTGNVGVIDKSGNQILPCVFEYIPYNSYTQGCFVVRRFTDEDTKNGYQQYGGDLTSPELDRMEDALVDSQGKYLIPFGRYDSIVSSGDGYVHGGMWTGRYKYVFGGEFGKIYNYTDSFKLSDLLAEKGGTAFPYSPPSTDKTSTEISISVGGETVTIPTTGTDPLEQTPTISNNSCGFTDVKASDYYADAIQWAVEKNITSGTSKTTFSPNVTCTKAQILTFLWHANGSPEPTAANPFADIQTGDYFYKAALWAAEKGLVSGSTFGANTDCTRAMTMEYMWKAAGSPAPAGKADFDDVPANAGYAQAVAWAVEKNITSGTGDGNFSPAATCTRGQIVTFLYRAMGK